MFLQLNCVTRMRLKISKYSYIASQLISIHSKATPNGCLVSGFVDFQIGIQVGSNCHYIIISLSDKCIKQLLFSRLVHAGLDPQIKAQMGHCAHLCMWVWWKQVQLYSIGQANQKAVPNTGNMWSILLLGSWRYALGKFLKLAIATCSEIAF